MIDLLRAVFILQPAVSTFGHDTLQRSAGRISAERPVKTRYLFDFPAIFGLLFLHGNQKTPRRFKPLPDAYL
jgi:hypothetical protein